MESEQTLSSKRTGLLKKIGYLSAVGILTVPLIAGCAKRPSYRPYPSSDVTVGQYNRDNAECESWAKRQYGTDSGGRAVEEGAKGAVLLGVLGAVLGALAGNAGAGGLAGAAIGATAGGLSGNAISQNDYDRAYRDCMRKKGH